MNLLSNLHGSFERYLRFYVLALDYAGQGQKEHWQLLELCRRRDVPGAVSLIERHIGYLSEILLTALKSDGGAQLK
jgi:DNA-binding GntR family transcriptional regulator